jgi:iron complex transport system substrate-binding protein
MGERVSLKDQPKRVVALTPALVDWVIQLGDRKLLVGVSEHSAHVENSEVVGSSRGVSYEKLASLKPDLVLVDVDANTMEVYRKLNSLKIPVVGVRTPSLVDIESVGKLIATALGSLSKWERISKDWDSKWSGFEERREKRKRERWPTHKVLLQLQLSPLVGVSPQTFLGEVLELMGAKNLVKNGVGVNAYPKLSVEWVVREAPDTIVFLGTESDQQALERFWTRFSGLPAVKAKRLITYSSDALMRPTPQILDAARELEIKIYGASPAPFPKSTPTSTGSSGGEL